MFKQIFVFITLNMKNASCKIKMFLICVLNILQLDAMKSWNPKWQTMKYLSYQMDNIKLHQTLNSQQKIVIRLEPKTDNDWEYNKEFSWI